jgi:hypothetical protein
MSERRADCGAALRLLHVGILVESIFWWCAESGDTLFLMANKPLFLQQ